MIKIKMPVPGKVTSPFGPRIHPKTKAKNFHNGLDIGCPTGTPIRADNIGTVVVSKIDGQGITKGLGCYIDVQYDGYCMRYAHLREVGLKVGTKVAAGQIIGYSGNTGSSTAPHLHFEYRRGKYDANYLKKDTAGRYLNAEDPITHM